MSRASLRIKRRSRRHHKAWLDWLLSKEPHWWRDSVPVTLARRMQNERDFQALPILADALEEAGCPSSAALAHCRGAHLSESPPNPAPHHNLKCWVVDDLLEAAKE